MRAHVLQHVPFEGVGSIQHWLNDVDADVTTTRFFAGDPIPSLDGIDLVIAMGGPMSVNDEAAFSWMKAEKEFIRSAAARPAGILGICLGAQLIASALGARVYPNAQKEIGWFPVRGLHSSADTFHLPHRCTVFHWHGETFDLPAGAVHLGETDACLNQAFQVGRRVIGLQFHLEATPAGVYDLVKNARAELTEGPFIQTEEAILNPPTDAYLQINDVMQDILEYLTAPE
jgi:GMP synthase-like glutamine amidotransferase